MRVAFGIFIAVALTAGASAQQSAGIVMVDDAPLCYVREGTGPPVAAIGSAVYYPRAYSAALRRSLDMIFVDSRHFVPSYEPSAEQLARVTLETFADDLEAVRAQLGVQRWAVIGHSIHAQICDRVCAQISGADHTSRHHWRGVPRVRH